MALQTSGAISLNEIHIEAGGASGTSATVNDSDIRGLIGASSGATMSFDDWYGASNVVLVGTGTVTGNVEDDVNFNSYSYGARNGDLVVLTGMTPWQLGSSALIVNEQSGTYDLHALGASTSSTGTNNRVIASYVHNGTNGNEKWYTNAVYDGLYASIGIQIFRGPTQMRSVSNGASPNASHAGWLVYDSELGTFQTESAPASIPALSGFTDSFNRYSGNIRGYSNGYWFDHMYSNRQRTQYQLSSSSNLPSGADSMLKFELRN